MSIFSPQNQNNRQQQRQNQNRPIFIDDVARCIAFGIAVPVVSLMVGIVIVGIKLYFHL